MKKVLLALAMVFTLTLVGCSQPDEKEKIAESYDLDTTEHVFDQIEVDEVETVVAEDQKAIIYFGSPT